MSQLAFGVYLIHPIIQWFLEYMPLLNVAVLDIILEWLLIVGISYVAVYLIARIPVLKKLVIF